MNTFKHFLENGPVKHGLPAFAYSSEEFQRQESESLFPNNWAFVGFNHELKEAGDAVPVSLAGHPLLIVRDLQGEIQVFHNVCRHRCLKLVEKPGKVGRVIKCPYHAWAYDLDGSLRATPYFGGHDHQSPAGFDKTQHGLVPVRFVVWFDWIFVNISGNAPNFERYVAPLAKRFENIDLSAITPVATLDFGEVRTNWKFLMENFIEPYHVQFVHKMTTDQPLVDHSTIIDGACLGSLFDAPNGDKKTASGNVLSIDSRYLTLFPNFVVGFYPPQQIGVYLNLPVAPGRTMQRRVIYQTGEVSFTKVEIEQLKDLWKLVHAEDHAICEKLQSGRASSIAADGGVLSPHWEDSVRRFQEMVFDSVRQSQ